MAFCEFSSHIIQDGSTLVDNAFINEFMPQAPADYVKVYLYGLSLCSAPNQDYNAADSAAAVLDLKEQALVDAYHYWQELGLVQIMCERPLEVKYLPIKNHAGSAKLRAKGKYADFNNQVQTILTGRMVRPIEYNEYYNIIERHHMEPEALVMIIKYCAINKGDNVSYAYIKAVANNFIEENIKTTCTVEQKLLDQEKAAAETRQVLVNLGLNRVADINERNTYLKWTKTFGFTHDVILKVSKSMQRGGFSKLDDTLTKYYEQHLFSIKEIEQYNLAREEMFETAKLICSKLGLYYQNLENVVDTYILDWINKGYTRDTLLEISQSCFTSNRRTLDSMNNVINKFYTLGLINLEAISQYNNSLVATNNDIKEVLVACGLERNVTNQDRNMYKIWVTDWGFSKDAILVAAKKCIGKEWPTSYLSNILSTLHENGKHSAEDVQTNINKVASSSSNFEKGIIKHEYTKEELNALFDSLDDIEV